jgi:hypothetical protein
MVLKGFFVLGPGVAGEKREADAERQKWPIDFPSVCVPSPRLYRRRACNILPPIQE